MRQKLAFLLFSSAKLRSAVSLGFKEKKKLEGKGRSCSGKIKLREFWETVFYLNFFGKVEVSLPCIPNNSQASSLWSSSTVEAPQINFRRALSSRSLAVPLHRFIVFPFRTDSTAVLSRLPAKEKGQAKASWLVPGLARDCTWAERTKKGLWLPTGSSSCVSRPEVVGLRPGGGCSLLAVIFPCSPSSRDMAREPGFLSWGRWG